MTWVEALRETIAYFTDDEYRWGEFDCCQFANYYYELMTGHNCAAAFEYDSNYDAAKILREHSGMVGLFTSILGEPTTPEAGDVVVVRLSEDDSYVSAGVYNGEFVWTVHPDQGLVRVADSQIMEAWKCQVV